MFFRLIALCFMLSVSAPHLAHALDDVGEAPEPSLPVEVALTYMKKTNQIPDFEKIALRSPGYLNAPEFAKKPILYREKQSLEEIYKNIQPSTGLIVFDDLKIENVNRDDLFFSFEGFDFNMHYVYEYNGEAYAVFVRNFDKYKKLPLQRATYGHIVSSFSKKIPVAAELTLRPALVDDKPFTLDDGRQAHLILADIVDLKLVVYKSGKVFYHEVAAEWKPKSRIDGIVKDILTKDEF